ncbi:hypothetical protein F4693_000734 [Sphingomonas endophytica]|uniref:Uncharacterized protein n=1 Tax=Sphingomonas endophytica TaxID=869719 RepID=A0A7X0MM05_9SPHN|nr:hypothetical protein [Sphingomonas endophytica]MBB6503779.1 hypothetical protein [Sphingomonas endophytica]
MSGRGAAGRFAPGFSSDRGRGRQPASASVSMPERVADLIMEIANMPVKIREPGRQRRRTVSLFEMMVLRLATGQTSRRRSVLPFIKLVISAASTQPLPARPVPAEPFGLVDLELLAARKHLDYALQHGSDPDVEDAIAHHLMLLRKVARRQSAW